jgi:3-dehydroquinate dehydratase-2
MDPVENEDRAVLVLHGPNLNLLGTREPEIYGSLSLEDIDRRLVEAGAALGLAVWSRQCNGEGALVDALQEASTWSQGVVFNPGGFAHTSVALRDTVAAISIPVIEVHLSNVFAREPFRSSLLIAPVCAGSISGFGWRSYLLGLRALADLLDGLAE